MASKHIESVECEVCDSIYKVSFDPDAANGLPKYCTFCGEDLEFEDIYSGEDDDLDKDN